MTITSTQNRVTYAGNGAPGVPGTLVFAVPFRFLQPSDLVVLVRVDATGVDTTKTLDTHYSVAGEGAAAGGTVTFLIEDGEPQTGETLIIYGNPPMTQTIDFQSGDPFPAETHEEALDKLTLQGTRTREIAERALSLTDSSVDGSGEYDANNNDIDSVGILSANKVTGLAVPTGTTDATSKTYVDALVNTTIGPIPPSDAYVTATGSSTSRKLADRFAETFNVKDYGAQGDGATDDVVSINAAFTAVNSAAGGTVYFPPGTYVIGSGVTLTLAGPTDLVADRATLKVVAGSIFQRALYVLTYGHDCTISGLEIDANQKALECARISEIYQDRSDLTMGDCILRNSYSDSTSANVGARLEGGWNKVTVDNCTTRDHTRATGAGSPGIAGTTGLYVTHRAESNSTCNIESGSPTMTMDSTADIAVGATVSGTGVPSDTHVLTITNGTTLVLDQDATSTLINTTLNIYRIPRYTTVQNCRFENITNGNTGSHANNMDADGLKIFGGYTLQAQYIRSGATVSNNSFVNCKGRSIKIQNDETTITGNTFYRNQMPVASGNYECTVLSGTGNVTSNTFQYDPTPEGLSPFKSDGSAGPGSFPINFYSAGYALRPKMMTATDNTIMNNVDPAVGYLGSAISCAGDFYSDQFIRISGNHAAGKYDYFVSSLRPIISDGDGSHLYANLTDNVVEELATAFMTVDSGSVEQYALNTVSLTGCHNSGPEVPAIVYPLTGTAPQGKYSLLNCSNITPEEYLGAADGTGYGHARIPTIASDSRDGGRISIQVATIADDGTYVFPKRAYWAGRNSIRMVSVANGSVIPGIFADAYTAFTDFASGASWQISYGGRNKAISGALPDNPVVVTSTAHGFTNGDTARISGVTGMTEINDAEYTVANVTTDTFELTGVDGTLFTDYVSGGYAAYNPNQDGKANIFRDNPAEGLVIKNRLGASTVFTLYTIG